MEICVAANGNHFGVRFKINKWRESGLNLRGPGGTRYRRAGRGAGWGHGEGGMGMEHICKG